MIACRCTISLGKMPPLSAHYFEENMGSVCSNILFVPCIHPFLCSSQSTCGDDNRDDSLDERVLQKINSTFVFTQDKSEQHASSVVTENHLE